MKIILFTLTLIFLVNCSTKKEKTVEYNPKYNYDVVTTEADSFGIGIYNNQNYTISYPQSYIYDYVLMRADSLVTGQLYSKIPYQIPADGKFHFINIGGTEPIYLKFKKVSE